MWKIQFQHVIVFHISGLYHLCKNKVSIGDNNMTPTGSNPGARAYMQAVRERLDTIASTQQTVVDKAASAIVEAVTADGKVYIFGTGHSHMMAEEGFFRAGGLAAVCPIFSSSLMLHEGAVASGQFERTPGVASILLNRYQPNARDVLIVFSNSGVNAAPVEMAISGKTIGMKVIAVVSLSYAAQAKAGPTGKKLAEVADIVIDNCGIPGDALVEIGETNLRVGPLSTVAGAFILNAIFTEVAWRIHERGLAAPVFISSNIPNSAEHNAKLIEKYRNPHT